MTSSSSRFATVTVALALSCSPLVPGAQAQTQAPAPRAGLERRADAPGSLMDAQMTREALMQILEKHPPSVGRILKLDPSLMRSETYLASYPELRDFLAQHSEIPQNSQYFLEAIRVSQNEGFQPRNEKLELAAGVLAGFAAFMAAGLVLGVLVWLIRTVLEQRRWSRLSKIQAEVHSKLMDRFSSNDELLTYVQTPSGRRFLESGPSPLQQDMAPAVAAPLARILWSMQIGAVLLVTGLGLLFLSGRALFEIQEIFYIAGCMATAVGAGFLVSSVAAYVLSRRLGLLDRPDRHTPGAAEINA
jgi:hypothetical protein